MPQIGLRLVDKACETGGLRGAVEICFNEWEHALAGMDCCSEHSAVCAEHPIGDMILWTQCLLNRNLFTCCVVALCLFLTGALGPFDKCHCLVFT